MNTHVNLDHYEVGFDIPAKPGMDEADIQTPCLILDLDGEKLKSEYLANIIAIKRAIEKYKIKKAFSFHSIIGAARDFTTSEGPINIGYHLDNFYTNFIEGKMGMKKRDEIMKRLSEIYPEYLWNQNKGYPTKKHKIAISEFGITKYHRKSFKLT